jgi:hypothetical protein
LSKYTLSPSRVIRNLLQQQASVHRVGGAIVQM